MKEIIILGVGGNCIDILDTINEINLVSQKYKCIGFLDDNPNELGKEYYGLRVIGSLTEASKYKQAFFVNGIGSSTNFWKKKSIIQKLMIPNERFETIIHPTASVSKLSKLGFGTVVFQNVTIASNVKIGKHVIILPNSVICHDSLVGAYSCLTSGVIISGNVTVGESCYLGTNSAIIDNINIGNYCLIGMCSNVIKDVADNSVMVGNPASLIRKILFN